VRNLILLKSYIVIYSINIKQHVESGEILMKIRSKLIIGIGLLTGIMLVSSVTSIVESKKTEQNYKNIIHENYQLNYDVKHLQFRLTGISNDERAYLLTGEESYLNESKIKKEDVRKTLKTLHQYELDTEDQELLGKVEKGITDYLNSSDHVIYAYENRGSEAAKNVHFTEERGIRKKLDPTIQAFIDMQNKDADSLLASTNSDTKNKDLLMMILSVFSVLLSISIGFIMVRLVTKPLQLLKSKFKDIADGNLASGELKISKKDEMSEIFESANQMIQSLKLIITQVRDTSLQLASSSQQLTVNVEETTRANESIASANEQLVVTSDNQLRNITETASVIQEMSAGITQVANHSSDVAELADQANDASQDGGTAVSQVTIQMGDINETVQQLSGLIQNLSSRSEEIGKILDIITGISAQTNLLALNAAIEAARAGEHGRGFAVVADEVRKLAEQSTESARQINELITTIQSDTINAVMSMEQGKQKVESGMCKAEEATRSFKIIEDAISTVRDKVQEVSIASQQMTVGSNKIVQTIEIVTHAAEETAGSCQQNAAASEEQLAAMEQVNSSIVSLNSMANQLETIVQRFKVS
jgi:methyl-accepting chemotaxis protein